MSEIEHKPVEIIEREEPTRMHPMVRAAMAQAPDPATLRELLAVQREWEADEARRAFTTALVALKRELPAVIGRDQKVDYASSKGRVHYTHASLAGVMDAVTPALAKYGFSVSWSPATEGSSVTVTCKLTHAGGHQEQTTISAPADTSGAKSPSQGVASTITLLSRYTALALLGIATADMVEPNGSPPTPDQIDSARNLKAAGALKKYGRTVDQAEQFLGRKVAEWTTADVEKLREWVKA
jgi:hypothetical protein